MRQRSSVGVRALAARALERGATLLSRSLVEWHASANCSAPVTIVTRGRPITRRPEPRVDITMEVIMHAPCRQCPECLARRAAHWRMRALSETAEAKRTWFGTLTLSPHNHFIMLSRARARQSKNIDIDTLSPEAEFGFRHSEICRELTLYFKRLRKTGARLRYLVVAEAHKSGLPHYHLLIHEVDQDRQVKHKMLKDNWSLGFTKFNLVTDKNQAQYLCKYLAKDARARVRASLQYGYTVSNDSSSEDERVKL